MRVQWSHCVLKVRDIEAMTQFYCDALGFEVADRGVVRGDTDIVFLSGSSTDHHQLGLMSGRSDVDDGSLDHMALRVASVEDVQQMVEWVEADDRIEDGMPVTHGNAVSVYFKDPEGNGVEIFCDTPWHVPQPVVAGWNPGKCADEVLAGIEQKFGDTPGFTTIDDYQARQAVRFDEPTQNEGAIRS